MSLPYVIMFLYNLRKIVAISPDTAYLLALHIIGVAYVQSQASGEPIYKTITQRCLTRKQLFIGLLKICMRSRQITLHNVWFAVMTVTNVALSLTQKWVFS